MKGERFVSRFTITKALKNATQAKKRVQSPPDTTAVRCISKLLNKKEQRRDAEASCWSAGPGKEGVNFQGPADRGQSCSKRKEQARKIIALFSNEAFVYVRKVARRKNVRKRRHQRVKEK